MILSRAVFRRRHFLSSIRTSPTTKTRAKAAFSTGRILSSKMALPFFADNFPYIADDKPFFTDDKPYIADDRPYIADMPSPQALESHDKKGCFCA
ncbi:hypothetical protein ABID16_004663 [Rhizobium aquaticum]|uniref:Uncharacterized protein n=1 Tax=Rhizobium aquaticum TaxID=1549636 RepID=A0ABV2J954_9HYPH